MIAAILWLLQLQVAVGETGKHAQLPVISFYTDSNYVVDIGRGGAALEHCAPCASFLDGIAK
eukprot:4433302-Pyramimonas_sp.AAC.1